LGIWKEEASEIRQPSPPTTLPSVGRNKALAVRGLHPEVTLPVITKFILRLGPKICSAINTPKKQTWKYHPNHPSSRVHALQG